MASPAEMARWFMGLGDAAEAQLPTALLQAGLLLESRIKARASGRPGPNVVTGNYRRSWNTRPIPGQLAVSVGTNHPAARRLDMGFTGVDSLGRVYNQPPFPHVDPGLADADEGMMRLLADAVEDAQARGIL